MFQQALKIAYIAHSGQYRRDSNVPYIAHPLRVSNCFNDAFKKTIAILHDVIEDTKLTIEDLQKDFPKKVVEIVDILSKREDETHFEYIRRVSKNEIATEIKIADIIDNLSDTICIQPKSMIDRYNKSLKILIEKL